MQDVATEDKGDGQLATMRQTACTATAALSVIRVSTTLELDSNSREKKLPEPTPALGDTGNKPTLSLSKREAADLRQCEVILEQGLGTFFDVGNALLRIRDNRLYRATHQTFQQYCLDRWNVGRIYAWRLIGAAERINLLPSGDRIPRPSNEFQVRPFLKLAPEEFPTAWRHAVERAKEGKITARIVRTIVEELSPPQPVDSRPEKRLKRTKPNWDLLKAQMLVLLQEARKRIQHRQLEEALAALDNIENELFKPGRAGTSIASCCGSSSSSSR